MTGNCHIARDTGEAIERAGFRFENIAYEVLDHGLPITSPTIRGVAIREG